MNRRYLPPKAHVMAATLAFLAAALAGCSNSNSDARDSQAACGQHPSQALPTDLQDSGVLKVATDVPYPPFEMFADSSQNQITGFDYDLGQAVGKKLGLCVKFIPQKFDGLIPGLQAHNYDAAMAAMTDNRERQRVVDFVDYFEDGTIVMVKKGNPAQIATLEDLCGQTIGEQSGSQQVTFVKAQQSTCTAAGKSAINVLEFPKISDVMLALKSGRVVAFLDDSIAAAQAAAKTDDGNAFEVISDPAAPGGYDSEPGGIAVLKGRASLVTALQGALQSVIDDGTYATLLKKYSMELGAVKEATVNAGVK